MLSLLKNFIWIPLPLFLLLLPDATWQTVLIAAAPWLVLVVWSLGEKGEHRSKWAVFLIALLGLGYALYLQISWAAGGIPQCSNEGCAVAQASSYADMFFGIRTSLVGVIGYSLLLLSLLLPGIWSRGAGLLLASFGFATSLFLSFSSVLVLGTTCQWCLGSASAMTALFFISLQRAWQAMK